MIFNAVIRCEVYAFDMKRLIRELGPWLDDELLCSNTELV